MLENLKAATFKVFETMFFLFPESLEEVNSLFRGPGLKVWIPIVGPKAFRVGLTVPLALARKMSANFLGLKEDQLSEDSVEDTLKEAANMVAGNFLGHENVSAAFHLEPPQSQSLNLDSLEWQPDRHHLLFAVEDHGLEVFLERTK